MNKRDENSRLIILISGVIVGFITIGFLIFAGTSKNRKIVKVGYILTGNVTDEGWNKQNYEGVKAACEEYGCRLYTEENIAENTGLCKKAVSELLGKGVSVIFLSSSSYADEVRDLIEKNPKVHFYSNHADFDLPNLMTYFVKMYQVRYLSGILAGCSTKTNEIGYIAAMPTSEVNRGINAFTMGVRRVNKDAKVIVKWTNSWDDQNAEFAAVDELSKNTNIDLLTYHVNKPDLVYYADKLGLKTIAYHTVVSDVESCLTSVICNWHIVYSQILSALLSGRDNRTDYFWLGIEDGAVCLYDYSPLVEHETKIKLDAARSQLLYGYNIFSGEIYDNCGNLRCASDEAFIDKVLLDDIDWIVEGAEIYE